MKFYKNPIAEKWMPKPDKEWILKKANESLQMKPVHITDAVAEHSEGGIHDYYSNGDYWWPNPNTPDGLPYIRRDGESNPNNFNAHRKFLHQVKEGVGNLAAGYILTGDERYAEKAAQILREFFIDEETKMNPHLLYAQAIPGVCSGRGIGIIDTLHIVEVPVAIEVLEDSKAFTPELVSGLKQWFADYLKWMTTHPYGHDEMNAKNNHSVCWFVQASVFAMFTGNEEIVDFCRNQYKINLLPNQMANDGSFTRELARTKPYGYSIFVLDNMATLCHVLSKEDDNLWEFELDDGRSIRKGFEFLYPYIEDKSKWPYPKDIQHFEDWPTAFSGLLFAGIGLGEKRYIDLWNELDKDPEDEEVRRNSAIRQPILWLR